MTIEADLEAIARQEKALVFEAFDLDAGWALGNHIRARARERGLGIVIDVTLFSAPVFYAALPGSTPDNANWVRRKRNCVVRFLRSSYATGLMLARQNVTLAGKFGLPEADYAAHGGSFPLTVASAGCIGAITVSGLPQREDHRFVVEMLCDRLGEDFAALDFSG
ncbi:heme-degrading domain-containing protein [Ensifer soli]|uniref:heme-degrading domain-containing protein n=1 Tax=Ciceribacter sp. sgz301302 TaxID=3342379 RepID=UPI0035B87FF9